jgi:DNA-binding transcriptional LysR family regulator
MGQDHRYKDIQLAQLRSFCVAATEGNFTAAAKALGLAASTVWQQVRALERELKARLLRRRGRSVELTDDGRLLLEMVQPHISGLDSLRHFFAARRQGARQELVVASGAYLFAHHLPPAIQQFREARPEIEVTLRIAAWSGLRQLVESEQTDVGILACDPDVPRSPALEYEHLFDERLCVIVPLGHALARLRRVGPQDVVKYPLILPPKGGADRRALDRVLRQHNLTDRVQAPLVCGLIDVVKQYVSRGMGVAVMYVTETLVSSSPELCVRSLAADVGPLPIEMAVRKGAYLPEHVEEFRAIVRKCLAQ